MRNNPIEDLLPLLYFNHLFRRIQIPDAKSVVRQHGGPVIGDGSPGIVWLDSQSLFS